MPIINLDIVLMIVAFTWHYALCCGYISDDHATVAQRKDIIPDGEKCDRGESFWVKRFNDGLVMYYVTAFGHALRMQNCPLYWHIQNYALHLCNTYLLYLWLFPLFGHDVALYASCFWAINPMLNQNVVWISGRPYLFGVMFALIAMIGWQDPICFFAFYSLAVITNIAVFFVPIIVWLAHPSESLPLWYLGIMVVLAFPFLVWKFQKRFKGGLVIDRDNFAWRPRKVNTIATMFLYYTWTFFVPVRMGWYHQAGFRYNEKWEKFSVRTLVGFCLIGAYAVNGLAGWFFILGLIPVCNIWATNSFLQDRYLYWCSIGIAIICAPFLAQYPALFYIATTFYVTRSYMYSRQMKNDELMYRENWRNHPHSDYAINNLSFFLIQQKRFDEARVVIERGLDINKNNKMLWYNLGITYASQGHFQNDEGKWKFMRALDCWKTCLAIEPRWTKPAEDLKRLIQLLVQKKVITMNPNEAGENGIKVTVPNLRGMEEALQGGTA